jgi:hypothetical protein
MGQYVITSLVVRALSTGEFVRLCKLLSTRVCCHQFINSRVEGFAGRGIRRPEIPRSPPGLAGCGLVRAPN